ncbi:MAG TPA: nuclear transport factor 2 family protein [Puia sp.]|nr:nuclear transport factor 2 family protein [Puia sp.]
MITETKEEARKKIWPVLLRVEKALVEKNASELEQLLSADFIGATPTGAFFTKTAYISHHCKPGFGIVALTADDMNATTIRIYNDTAVINRRVHSRFKLPTGKILDYDVQRIEVLVQQNNEWRMVSGQGTQVIPL